MAPSFSAAKYMIRPFFSKKVYYWPHFSVWIYERPHFSDVSRYMHMFVQRFFEAACSLDIQWIECDICLTTSNKWVQKNQRAVYGWVNISDDLVYEWVRFFKGQVSVNGVGFEILARTSVPHLPQPPKLNPLTPHPHPATRTSPSRQAGEAFFCSHITLSSRDIGVAHHAHYACA